MCGELMCSNVAGADPGGLLRPSKLLLRLAFFLDGSWVGVTYGVPN